MWEKNYDSEPTVFYHETIANVCKSLEAFFQGLYIGRQAGNRYSEYEVPVTFTQKDVMISKLQQECESKERDIRTVLPRMGLSIIDINSTNLSGSNQTDQFIYYTKELDSGSRKLMYNGIPVKLTFELVCVANKLHELFNIYENIVPRFRKTVAIHVEDTILDIKRDLQVALTNENFDLSRTIEFGKNRVMQFTLELETTCYIYPPISDVGVIKHIYLNYINATPVEENLDDIREAVTSYKDDLAVMVVDRWDVDPSSAEKNEPHDQVLTRTDDPGTPYESSQELERTEHNK